MRVGACEHGRVARGRHGVGVAVLRVGEPGAAVEEALEPVGSELVPVLDHLALRQPVDDDEDHEPGLAAHDRRRNRVDPDTPGEERQEGRTQGQAKDAAPYFVHLGLSSPSPQFFHESASVSRCLLRTTTT